MGDGPGRYGPQVHPVVPALEHSRASCDTAAVAAAASITATAAQTVATATEVAVT